MNPILQLNLDGTFTYNGQPFLWSSFFKHGTATQNPVDFTYIQTPPNDPFFYNGVQYAGGSYILFDSAKTIVQILSATEFALKFTDKGLV